MDKIENVITSLNHSITITERKNIVITGVKKIENFDENDFLMETSMGMLTLKGENLEIIKLDTYQGNVSIKGKINSASYLDGSEREKEGSFLGKLFK